MTLPLVRPMALRTISNVFTTFAWCRHLRFTDRPLFDAVGFALIGLGALFIFEGSLG